MERQDCIFFQLRTAGQVSRSFYSKKLEHLGLTADQAVVLNFLGEEDCILSRELGDKINKSSASMTGLLDRLEKLGLVERRGNDSDRRAILIALTKSGKKVAKEVYGVMVQSNEEFLDIVKPDEKEVFTRVLKRLMSTNK